MSVDPIRPAHRGPNARDAERTARSARTELEELEREVAFLNGQLGRLKSLTEALWFLVRNDLAQRGADASALASEVESRLRAFEARTGDEPAPCPDCARPLGPRSERCAFCGYRRE